MTNRTVFGAVCWTFSLWLAFDYGVAQALASCRTLPGLTTPKKPVGYEMSKRQLRRMIRYEQAKGGVL